MAKAGTKTLTSRNFCGVLTFCVIWCAQEGGDGIGRVCSATLQMHCTGGIRWVYHGHAVLPSVRGLLSTALGAQRPYFLKVLVFLIKYVLINYVSNSRDLDLLIAALYCIETSYVHGTMSATWESPVQHFAGGKHIGPVLKACHPFSSAR